MSIETLARIALVYARRAADLNSLELLRTAHELVDLASAAETSTRDVAEPLPLRATPRWRTRLHRLMNRLWQQNHPGVLGLFRRNLTGSVFLSETDTGDAVIALGPETWRDSDLIATLPKFGPK